MPVVLTVQLVQPDGFPTKAVAPLFPADKPLGYWLVFGDTESGQLLSIKRLTLAKKLTNVKLEFNAPNAIGRRKCVLYLMSDSVLGADQEYEIAMDVAPADDPMDE